MYEIHHVIHHDLPLIPHDFGKSSIFLAIFLFDTDAFFYSVSTLFLLLKKNFALVDSEIAVG